MILFFKKLALLALLSGLLAVHKGQAQTVTPAQWLTNQAKPAFKAGHTLPRLTRYGYAMAADVRIKLCEDWGYALEFSDVSSGGVYDTSVRLNNPGTVESRMAALAKSDPVRYPLSVVCTNRMPTEADAPAGTFIRKANGQTYYNRLWCETASYCPDR